MIQQFDVRREAIIVHARYSEAAIYFSCKRCIDVVLSLLLLAVLAPLLLCIAVLIKLDTAGPIIFTQERVGSRRRSRRGQIVWEIHNFNVYKFRSMVRDADQSVHLAHIKAFVEGRLERSAGSELNVKLSNDARVTRVGRVLRRTSLDELPQLVNVLRGEMSIVGPRPVPTYEVEAYDPSQRQRLAALPGITGLWQVKGRGRVTFEEMIALDIEYVRNQSLWLDTKILLQTVPEVLTGRGAE